MRCLEYGILRLKKVFSTVDFESADADMGYKCEGNH